MFEGTSDPTGIPSLDDLCIASESRPSPRPAISDLRELIGDQLGAAVHVHLKVNGADSLGVAWHARRAEDLASCVRDLLDYHSQLWSQRQWRQVVGLDPVHWAERLVLLCQVQLKARNFRQDKFLDKFIVLPDGRAISTHLLWPRNQPTSAQKPLKNPLTRLPELVTLFALGEIYRREQEERPIAGQEAIRSDERLASELEAWLRERGASDAWLLGSEDMQRRDGNAVPNASHIRSFRAKLRSNHLDQFLPTTTERRRKANAGTQ